MFSAIARRFKPIAGFAFEGDIAYELDHVDGAGPSQPAADRAVEREPARWTIRVRDGSARTIAGTSPDAAVTLRVSIPDFARMAADEIKPPELFFGERLQVSGDFEVASRLPEMFGERSPF